MNSSVWCFTSQCLVMGLGRDKTSECYLTATEKIRSSTLTDRAVLHVLDKDRQKCKLLYK